MKIWKNFGVCRKRTKHILCQEGTMGHRLGEAGRGRHPHPPLSGNQTGFQKLGSEPSVVTLQVHNHSAVKQFLK